MKKVLPLLVIVLLLASAWLAWELGHRMGESRDAVTEKTDTQTAEKATAAEGEAQTLNDDVWAEAVPNETAVRYPPRPKGALRGEATLIFASDEAYAAALRYLREAGVPVLNTIPGLRAIRIGTHNPAWRRIGFDPGNVGYNFPIGIPPPPANDSPYQHMPNLAFGDTLLEFLGVDPEANGNWGEGIKIAVLDSGVDLDHPALDGANITVLGSRLSEDVNGHGTAVISLIAGQDQTVIGIAPAAEILSVQVTGENGLSDTFSVAEGIVAAVDAGASIINLSLGAYGDSPVLRAAVNYALDNNVAVVAAVGNDGANQVAYPAAYDGVIPVGSVGAAPGPTAAPRPAGFSNYGDDVGIAAPGVGLPAAWIDDLYVSFSGTSASSPLVAAAGAVVMQHNPTLTSQQAMQVVVDAANDAGQPGKDDFLGEGILNVDRALDHGQRGIFDAAVADHYVNYAESNPTAYQVEVLVENRGTEYLSGLQLTVAYEERTATFYLGGLNPNEVVTQPILLNPTLLKNPEGTLIKSTITSSGTDSEPGNDSHITVLRLMPVDVEP